MSWILPRLLCLTTLLFAKSLEPAPVETVWWAGLHESFLKNAAAESRAKVLFIGDSITDFWATDGAKVWKEQLAPFTTAANLGVSGDRVENMLWRVERGKELDGRTPELVVLLAGTNNVPLNKVEEIADTYAALVRAIRSRLPKAKLVLVSVFPRSDERSKKTRWKIAPLNARIARLAAEPGIMLLNLNPLLVDKQGKPSPAYFTDGLHLTEAGYALWWRELRALMQRGP